MVITINWKEHGENFAGVYEAAAVDAQFKVVVVRTLAGTVTVPYACMTGFKTDAEGAEAVKVFNQASIAKAIGAEIPAEPEDEEHKVLVRDPVCEGTGIVKDPETGVEKACETEGCVDGNVEVDDPRYEASTSGEGGDASEGTQSGSQSGTVVEDEENQ